MSTAVALPKNDIRSLLAKPETIHELGRVATKHLTADRLARLVLSACNRVPKLLDCTPQSVLSCALTCSQYGVEPDGRHAHLIPYGNTCTLIIDWKGLVALGRRGGIEAIVADTICEADEFTYFRDEAGTHFKHVPKFGNRGEVIGAYSTAKINGEFDVEVLTRDEIEGIRKRSKAGGSGPWVTDFGEMAKKTAIRRHSKRWPLSEEVAGAFLADDDVLPDVKREVRKPIFGTSSLGPVRAIEDQAAPVLDADQIPDAEVPAPPKRQRRAPEPAQEAPVEEPTQSPTLSLRDRLSDFLSEQRASFDDFKMASSQIGITTEAKAELWTAILDVPNSVCSLALAQLEKLAGQLAAQKEA